MNLPRTPLPENNLQSWLGRFHASTKRLQPGDSDTISIINTPDGVLFEVKDHALAPKNLVSGFEEYVDGNAYALNTLVYVKEWKRYKTRWSMPGIYICVSPVPPLIDTKTLSNVYLKQYYSTFSQEGDIIYAPIIIEDDERKLAYETDDGDGKYWHCIAPAIMVGRDCIDGTPISTYTAAQTNPSES